MSSPPRNVLCTCTKWEYRESKTFGGTVVVDWDELMDMCSDADEMAKLVQIREDNDGLCTYSFDHGNGSGMHIKIWAL